MRLIGVNRPRQSQTTCQWIRGQVSLVKWQKQTLIRENNQIK